MRIVSLLAFLASATLANAAGPYQTPIPPKSHVIKCAGCDQNCLRNCKANGGGGTCYEKCCN